MAQPYAQMNDAEVRTEEKRLLREWLSLSASMVVVDGRAALPAKKKDLEARTRKIVGEEVPNFT